MKKYITVAGLLIFGCNVLAQKPNWQNLDLNKDSVFGISTEKVYSTVLKDKHLHKVIVAVIGQISGPIREKFRVMGSTMIITNMLMIFMDGIFWV